MEGLAGDVGVERSVAPPVRIVIYADPAVLAVVYQITVLIYVERVVLVGTNAYTIVCIGAVEIVGAGAELVFSG